MKNQKNLDTHINMMCSIIPMYVNNELFLMTKQICTFYFEFYIRAVKMSIGTILQ